MGIEPTLFAWEAKVLPLNYTRLRCLEPKKMGLQLLSAMQSAFYSSWQTSLAQLPEISMSTPTCLRAPVTASMQIDLQCPYSLLDEELILCIFRSVAQR